MVIACFRLRWPRLCLVVLLGLCLAAPLQAQTSAVAIAPGPLSAALSAYAARAGVLLSFDPALTRDLTTQGLSGSYGFEEGLRQLLQGSGLEPVRRADGGYTLRRAPASN